MEIAKLAKTQNMLSEMKVLREIRVGVVGCGYWGPNLIRNFVETPQSHVVAVADLRPERLKMIRTSYPQIQPISDYRDLFNMEMDAVVIATPPSTHYEIAKDFLEHDIPVMVEKPLTLNSEHAEMLIELAHRKDLVLMVGHAFEYNVAVQALKSMIDKGELGKLHYIDSARLNLGLYQRGTNVLWDLAPHDISILCYILGTEPVSVIAQGASCISKGVFDVVYMNLMFPDNILAHVHVSWLDPYKVRRVTVVGSEKMVIFNDIETDKIKIIDKGVDTQPEANNFAEFQYSYRNGDIVSPYIRFVEPLRREAQHFLDCVSNHHTPLSNGEDGLRVVRILEAAQCSLENFSREEGI
jgi:predicted dehydrogenase